ncbi:cell envelope biogenesis protein OmpA [Formosa sp. PL04]|uniref:cell envelope biogenesis protein OmpA n=1 Tax=Formosa sp. PL04 TaxID=3081755 RepID=UPI0029825B9B|nr:cell envelope biogenesis protein OmpA [Formosa sp. PL04]MDW5289234.1 cell envelope biogenesis protein OmpA [Formosa sp. PL04]
MSSKLKQQKYISAVVIFLFLFSLNGFAQIDEDVLRFEMSFGGNHALESGFSEGYSGNSVNIPTLNIGAQYMFTNNIGAKLDLGFNRIKGSEDDFKINYTRVNAQGVYDYSSILGVEEKKPLKLQVHAGPGFSFVRPLGGLNNVDQNYFNAMIGTNILYALNRNSSVFFDVSYIHGFTKPETYSPLSEGLGAFNGSMITFTIGISLSLSGCYYCN